MGPPRPFPSSARRAGDVTQTHFVREIRTTTNTRAVLVQQGTAVPRCRSPKTPRQAIQNNENVMRPCKPTHTNTHTNSNSSALEAGTRRFQCKHHPTVRSSRLSHGPSMSATAPGRVSPPGRRPCPFNLKMTKKQSRAALLLAVDVTGLKKAF